MGHFTEETKRRVVRYHIQNGRTIASLSAEYGASIVFCGITSAKKMQIQVEKACTWSDEDVQIWRRAAQFDRFQTADWDEDES